MFDLDSWQEIFSVMGKNKLRAFLTGFSVAWGIFMLIILLGAGNGFENAMRRGFERSLINSMWIWGGKTTMPYKGLNPGRHILLSNKDYDQLKENIPEVELISSVYNPWGQSYVAYKGKSVKYRIISVHPDYQAIDKITFIEGRPINNLDIMERRKVAIITEEVKRELFNHSRVIGENININGFYFKVIGVVKDKDKNNNQLIGLPITTAQLLYGGRKDISNLALTIPASISAEESLVIEDHIRKQLAARHNFDPEDKRAVFVSNSAEQVGRFMTVINSIRLFIWIIGVMTVVAGVVGVSNIMTIVVKERTREIGVRKALGARPASITGMIMQEAMLITSVSGFIGLLSGISLLELIRTKMPGNDYFYNPEANITIAVSATVFLIAAGLLAGFFPARKAAGIKPIVALRDE